jgi:hypothetical protein
MKDNGRASRYVSLHHAEYKCPTRLSAQQTADPNITPAITFKKCNLKLQPQSSLNILDDVQILPSAIRKHKHFR